MTVLLIAGAMFALGYWLGQIERAPRPRPFLDRVERDRAARHRPRGGWRDAVVDLPH